MPDNSINPDDPTLRIRPRSSQPDQDQQGRLVIGSFQNQPQPAQRRPYQYPPPQQPSQSSQRYPQGQSYQNTPPRSPMPPREVPAPASYPDATRYPYVQPGQLAGGPGRPRRRRGKGVGCLVVLLLLVIIGGFTFTTAQRVLAFGSAISTKSPLSTDTGYMGTSQRTNLLVLGYGGGTHDGAYLTDSIVVVSLLPQTHHTSLISVPRDLWVQNPPNSGQYTKINAVYEFASNNGKQPSAGGDTAAAKVALVTGLDVKYWLTIDFTGFKKVIDSIGGVDVYVPDSFNACYPKNDDAAVDPSWIKVQFNKGTQHMDGATAIEYARAREPLEVCGMGTSQNLAELTDFGRSARQQIIIKAVLAKIKQASTWPHLYDAMDALQQSIHTNMSLADLSEFALKMDLNDPKAAHIGLSNQNVLEDSQAAGQYILAPRNGQWSLIPDYINQHLYN
ncbi:MAG TPA: LCP family protein [Ktedonobacteraceae bacterium]|nr:LCP family protein [Ktedonobacteraceae bacterium]